MKRAYVVFMLIFLTALVSTQAAAAATSSAAQKLVQIQVPPIGSSSTIGLPSSSIAIEAGTDKTTASAKLGNVWTSSDGVSVYHWGFSGKAPFDSTKDDSVDLGTLSGLTAGSSAKLEFGWFHWPPTNGEELLKQKLCKTAIESMVPGYSWYIFGDKDTSEFHYLNHGGKDEVLGKADCNAVLTGYEKLQSAIEARNKATEDATKPISGEKPKAAELPSRDVFDQWSQKFRDEVHVVRAEDGFPMGITIAATANRQKFSFADSATSPTKIMSEIKEGYGASISGTLVRPWYVVGAGYEYSKTFKGGSQTEICTPIGTSSATSCANGGLKPPTEKIDHLLFVEGRSIINISHEIGLSPRLEYSAKTHDFGVQLPIYLAHNKDQYLDGGIKLGWTKDDHWGVSIFVGKAFSFF